MLYGKIKEAVFISRPNRFLAEVLVDGTLQSVHVKNTGRCRELLYEGVKVYLEDHGDTVVRKTRYSLITVEKADEISGRGMRYVNIDSQVPNRIVAEALADGRISLPGFNGELSRIKPETTFGDSRFDFYVEDDKGKKGFIEVKGVTLEEGGIARFPDAPTERGIKHVKELERAIASGYSAFLIFVIQMKGIFLFEPNDRTHPAFGDALRQAELQGLTILAYDCEVAKDRIEIRDPVKIKL